MSEFKVIKCSKCHAALVELQGQKLNKCIQCGHSFNLQNKTKINRNVDVTQTVNSPVNTTINKKSSNSSYSVIGTIIKWYLFISVVSIILKQFF